MSTTAAPSRGPPAVEVMVPAIKPAGVPRGEGCWAQAEAASKTKRKARISLMIAAECRP